MKLLLQHLRSWNSCRIKNKERKIRKKTPKTRRTTMYIIFYFKIGKYDVILLNTIVLII